MLSNRNVLCPKTNLRDKKNARLPIINQTFEWTRDRRVGVADLGNTCSDW